MCYKYGHDAYHCWNRFDPNFVQPPPPSATNDEALQHFSNPYQSSYGQNSTQAQPKAYVAAHQNAYTPTTQEIQIPAESQTWFPDSGATHHVTPDAHHLTQGAPFSGSEQVHIGNGQGLNITSVGSSQFLSPSFPNVTLTLNDLLVVPSITKNLVLVSRFAKDNNVYFEFHPSYCCVKCQVYDRVLLKGNLGSDGLYSFQQLYFLPSTSKAVKSSSLSHPAIHTVIKPNNPADNCSSFSNFAIWHRRLGHAHAGAVRIILDLCKVPYQNKSITDFCSGCCLGKAHRLHSPASKTVYTKPFELIFSDLWGPAPHLSTCGYLYYITFVDAFTRYTWIYFLKKKSDALAAFHQFYSLINTQFSTKLKSIQTDWGGEFRVFTKFLNDQGIIHRLTCPHTSHQNGIVERKHRQIVEMRLTLLAQAQLPYKFWDHSFTASVHLINRLPTTASSQYTSPYHYSLYNKIPDYTMLRTFGCACFPSLRPYNQHKLDYRSQECINLGISPQHKGYKCLAANGRIYISKDVLFNELRFPYATLFPSPSKPAQPPSTFPSNIPLTYSHLSPNLSSSVTTSASSSSPTQV